MLPYQDTYIENTRKILFGLYGLNRHFCNKIPGISRVFGKCFSNEVLRIAVVIDIGGVIIVDTVGVGVINQCLRFFVINRITGISRGGRKPHTAIAQLRKLLVRVFICFVDHIRFLLF